MSERKQSSKEVTLQLVKEFDRAVCRHSCLGNKEKLDGYLQKLYIMPMKVSYLRESRICKTVQEIVFRNPEFKLQANALLFKWKRLLVENFDKDTNSSKLSQNSRSPVKLEYLPVIPKCPISTEMLRESIQNELMASFDKNNQTHEEKDSDKKQTTSKPNSNDKKTKNPNSDNKRKSNDDSRNHKLKRRRIVSGLEIDHQSGTSFADALTMMDTKLNQSKKIQLKKKSSTIPTSTNTSSSSTSNSPNINLSSGSSIAPSTSTSTSSPCSKPSFSRSAIYGNSILPPRKEPQSDSESSPEINQIRKSEFLENMTTSKTNRTKVYSGLRSVVNKVPSLIKLCTQVLRENLTYIEYTGGIPYIVMKQVIEQATPEQLQNIENHNPYLKEDTEELWEIHCMHYFREQSKQYVNKLFSWRDIYFQCVQDSEERLKSITNNIKKSINDAAPQRQTKLAIIDPVALIRGKRLKDGVPKTVTTNSQKIAAKKLSEKASVVVPAPAASKFASVSCNNNILKPKPAPLMQKALRILKTKSR